MTQERRQDERRRRRLARQQQKRSARPARTEGAASTVEFGGAMGWIQRNAKWAFLLVGLLFVGGTLGSSLYRAPPPTPTPIPSATATASATPSASATGSPSSRAWSRSWRPATTSCGAT